MKTSPLSSIYTREKLANLPKTSDRSKIYWRAQAREALEDASLIAVEICIHGRKTDSVFLGRGESRAPKGIKVIVASTGGKYGKSRRTFAPGSHELTDEQKQYLI